MLRIHELVVGQACPPGRLVRRGTGWRPLALPVRVFLLEHPDYGQFLWDTGYGPAFWRATRWFPARLLRWLIPPRLRPEEQLTRQVRVEQLAGLGISHFHPDHIGSVPDLPPLPTWVSGREWRRVQRLGPWQSLHTAHLKALFPRGEIRFFEDLPAPLWPGLEFLGPGWDWFGDGSARIFQLPGHTRGHLGLWMETLAGPLFAVGDAYYVPEQLDGVVLPVPTRWVVEDARAYQETLDKLKRLRRERPEVVLRACHEP
ncbi:MAG: MBL fold metallo-hydrolase [Candidatus Eremiobacteraeota bacterium]|nr:MBL fold metallo-hydrolase [Candidatus Eremiobacteraeota bacterium]